MSSHFYLSKHLFTIRDIVSTALSNWLLAFFGQPSGSRSGSAFRRMRDAWGERGTPLELDQGYWANGEGRNSLWLTGCWESIVETWDSPPNNGVYFHAVLPLVTQNWHKNFLPETPLTSCLQPDDRVYVPCRSSTQMAEECADDYYNRNRYINMS